jgi:hypothetical protein
MCKFLEQLLNGTTWLPTYAAWFVLAFLLEHFKLCLFDTK